MTENPIPNPEWSVCRCCGLAIFRHFAWSHEGGTPPQDHYAEPPDDDDADGAAQ